MNARYRARYVSNLERWSIGALELKAYLIRADAETEYPRGLLESARDFAERVVPTAARREGESEELGYAIVHVGTIGTWLLMHWWAHEDICCQRLALAAPGTTAFESVDDRPLMACVWEQVVMQHERDAWVATAMGEAGDRAAYLEERLADGYY